LGTQGVAARLVPTRIKNQETRALIDSGASGNFVSKEEATRLGLRLVRIAPVEASGADGEAFQGQGRDITYSTLPETMMIGTHQEVVTFYVLHKSAAPIILGRSWLKKHEPTIDWKTFQPTFEKCRCHHSETFTEIEFGPMPRWQKRHIGWITEEILRLEVKEPTEIPTEYTQYSEVFKNDKTIGALPKHKPWDHVIPLEPGKHPTFGPIYSLSPIQMKALREYIEENLKKGFIRKSSSPAGYPILFAPKKDGTLRLCVDYRQLNNITIKNRYPLPLTGEMQERLHGAKIFTKLDLRGAYNLVRMAKGEEWKTAFRTRYGHFEYQVMPFGLTNAPATCQQLVNDTLREYLDDFVLAYLDDILIYSKNLEDHEEQVKKVLKALEERDLRVKLDKCTFWATEVEYLGFIVSTEGIKMNPGKVKAILEWPEPTTVKETQSFLGFANFYRRFVKDYSRVATPLTNLTRKDQKFCMTSEARQAFQTLKEAFTKAPILVSFDPEKEIMVETDASDYALGGVINQQGTDGKWHPIAFYSRKLTAAELNYEIHDKELLAIVECLREWRVYLEGPKHKVKIYSDHKNLLYFTTTKVLNRRQVRWSETLAAYNFEILYKKGNENGRADALSRRADYVCSKPEPSHAIFDIQGDTMLYNRPEINTISIETNDETELQAIRKEYPGDTAAQRILKNLEEHRMCRITTDGTILFEERVYVPKNMRNRVVQARHSAMPHGHPGIGKTLELVSRTFYFPGMRKVVERVINGCDTCCRNKAARHMPYGKLHPLKAPPGAWRSVSMDFITDLPPSLEPLTNVEWDSILVIVDRLTKYAYFIPWKKTGTAEDAAYAFYKYVYANHGMPEEIISDRDTRFTSAFWKSLMGLMGTRQAISTAFHPQTDGQTERTNQTLETYLRHYVNYRQTNWVRLLPVAQFAWCSASGETLKTTPFYANYGIEPRPYGEPKDFGSISEYARIDVEQIKNLHDSLVMDIKFFAERMAFYANKKRLGSPRLKKGDKVYLLRRNIQTTRPSDKLDHKKLGPFVIEQSLKPVNYKLRLPDHMRIHPVFHISLLEPAPANARMIVPELLTKEDNQEYEVERVIDHNDTKGERQYLIKWKGFGESDNTWEPEEGLLNAKAAVRQYLRENPEAVDSAAPRTRARARKGRPGWRN
jgi:hypothetical protein